MPRFLPLLALLLLLLPKRNRSAQALWVAAPLAVTLGVEFLLWSVTDIGADAWDGIYEILGAVPFGLAAVWILSPYLKVGGRFPTCLLTLAAAELAAVFTCVVTQPQDGDKGPGDILIGIAVFSLVLILAIHLAGWSCRRWFSRWRFSVRLILWLIACWLVFFTVMSVIEGAGPVLEMVGALLTMSALSFGLVLPFLVLSFANAFYHARLREFLCLPEAAPPAAHQPPVPAALAAPP